jgi:hypothetical protein
MRKQIHPAIERLELRSESDGTVSDTPIPLCSDILERILKCNRISCGIHRRGAPSIL